MQNIEKAKKEIERLEAEEAAAGNGSGGNTPSKEANGEAGTDETVAEAAKKVAEVSIEDKEAEAPKEAEATA